MNESLTKMYQRSAAICSRAEKSSHAIFEKLLSWGLKEDEASQVVNRLTAEKYIDDRRYARSYAHDRFSFSKWGKIKIAFHLRMEKVGETEIREALETIEEDDYRETLRALLRSKNKTIRANGTYDHKGKLFRFAKSRGFEPELIYQLINELTG